MPERMPIDGETGTEWDILSEQPENEQQAPVTLFEALAEATQYTGINMSNHTTEKPDYDDQ